MGQIFHSYEPEQSHLFPASPRDWMPEGHLAFFISDTIDELNLEALYEKYRARATARGNLAYEPRMMLKVLIYSYSQGIFSSRKIAAGLDDLVALRFLSAGNRPGHRTVARFRKDNTKHFALIFAQIVKVAQAAGLVGMGTIAIDGSRLRANASKHKSMSYGRMQAADKKLSREIARILDRANEIDEAEDAEFGPDFRDDELPAELQQRETRRERIRQVMRELEAEQAESDEASGRGKGRTKKMKRPNGTPPDNTQRNFTDPESRIMKTSSGGFEQCFNAQVAVDAQAQIIIASGVTQSAADVRELIPTLDRATRIVGKQPEHVLADAGYRSEANFAALEARKVEGLVSLGRREETKIEASKSGPASKRMSQRLESDAGRKRFKTRKHIVEPVFGWAKRVLGFRTLSMRGLEAANAEWELVCTALNLRRMSVKMALR